MAWIFELGWFGNADLKGEFMSIEDEAFGIKIPFAVSAMLIN